MQSVEKVQMRKGVITQAFDASASRYLETKGWERVEEEKPAPEKAAQKTTSTKKGK